MNNETSRRNERVALTIATVAIGAMVAYPHIVRGEARRLPSAAQAVIDRIGWWDCALSAIGWGIGVAAGFWVTLNLATAALVALDRRRAIQGTATRAKS